MLVSLLSAGRMCATSTNLAEVGTSSCRCSSIRRQTCPSLSADADLRRLVARRWPSIYDEFVIGLSKDQFMNVLKYVYKDPYDFLFMNFDEPWDQVYHRNFNKLVLDA